MNCAGYQTSSKGPPSPPCQWSSSIGRSRIFVIHIITFRGFLFRRISLGTILSYLLLSFLNLFFYGPSIYFAHFILIPLFVHISLSLSLSWGYWRSRNVHPDILLSLGSPWMWEKHKKGFELCWSFQTFSKLLNWLEFEATIQSLKLSYEMQRFKT